MTFYEGDKTRLTPEQLITVLRRAGWPNELVGIAYAIVMRESSRYPKAYLKNTNGTIDRGLFQINEVNNKELGVTNWQLLYDPIYNAKKALTLFNRYNLSPWALRNTDGSYTIYAKYLRENAPQIQADYQAKFEKYLSEFNRQFPEYAVNYGPGRSTDDVKQTSPDLKKTKNALLFGGLALATALILLK